MSGGAKILLGSADLISLSRNTYQYLRDAISGDDERTHCAVGLATTHTHSGPATVKMRHCGRMDTDYIAEMKDAVLLSGSEAAASDGNEVAVVWGSGSCDTAINRRSGEEGPIDREVIVVGFMDAKTGAPVATVVNFACHPVVLGHDSNAVSADYPGYLTAFMEAQTGASCLFF